MNAQQLFRMSGAAAIAGGALRIFSALSLLTDPIALEWLYTTIDVLLLLGWIGIYLVRADKLGFLGLVSFIVGVAALSFIGGPDADPFGFSTYREGAMTLVIATLGLSIAWIRVQDRPIAAPILWFISALAAGVIGMTGAPLQEYAFQIAGAVFGAAFVVAGWDLVRR